MASVHNGAAVIPVQTSFVKMLLDWQQEVTPAGCSYTVCFANDRHSVMIPFGTTMQRWGLASGEMVHSIRKCHPPQEKDGQRTRVVCNVGPLRDRERAGLAAFQLSSLPTSMMLFADLTLSLYVAIGALCTIFCNVVCEYASSALV